METAEQLIHQGPIDNCAFGERLQGQDVPADHRQVFVALGKIVVEELRGDLVVRSGTGHDSAPYSWCRNRGTSAASMPGRNGLVR